MNLHLRLTLLAAALGACHGARFDLSGNGDQHCSTPTWRCDCKLVYACEGAERFPDDVGDDPALAGYVKELAPSEYPLEIPGKRWRKNKSTSEAFCERECEDRMNAFLCLDDGDLTDYSYSAVCLKLLAIGSGPFSQDGMPEPCCTIFLQYGPQWCTKKWHRAVDTVRCLTLSTIDFSSVTSDQIINNVFSVETGCSATDADGGSFDWCGSEPMCVAPLPPS